MYCHNLSGESHVSSKVLKQTIKEVADLVHLPAACVRLVANLVRQHRSPLTFDFVCQAWGDPFVTSQFLSYFQGKRELLQTEQKEAGTYNKSKYHHDTFDMLCSLSTFQKQCFAFRNRAFLCDGVASGAASDPEGKFPENLEWDRRTMWKVRTYFSCCGSFF